MLRLIKTVLTYPPLSFPRSLYSNLGRETSVIRFGTEANHHHMDKDQKPGEGDVMSHSFGEGYATRSDEEGFGGVYGGNQSISKTETEKSIHESHPAYDKTQGSEVKEKEKARHQTNADA
ncbi:hypothetical protein Fmac_002512 [Flemingia macrophylla]|uniref:Late embryogenesis abundant protein n=1 Tax=Flemingia macrophylla TaxID=520843 RepID=A0ABD1NLH1_9FABA